MHYTMENTNGFHHTNGNGQMIADMIGDDHAFTNVKTPLRYDAFLTSDVTIYQGILP